MSRRTKTEMEELDARIRPLYEQGIGCRTIGETLGEHSALVFKRLTKMGLMRNTDDIYAPLTAQSIPFNKNAAGQYLRDAALGTAIDWFLKRGYVPSIPVVPVRYDLAVESDAGFQRIQVKTTNCRQKNGKFLASIARRIYDSKQTPNAMGKRRPVAYTEQDVDFFFIVDGNGTKYLIPIAVVSGQISLVLDTKYKEFVV